MASSRSEEEESEGTFRSLAEVPLSIVGGGGRERQTSRRMVR